MLSRASALTTLHRLMPGCSVRRIGDLLSSAALKEITAPNIAKMPMAFGMVLDGYVRAGDEGSAAKVFAPGEIFGLPQFVAEKQDRVVVVAPLEGQEKATFLAFNQNAIASLNLPEIANAAGNL